jgi:hypothetical protein
MGKRRITKRLCLRWEALPWKPKLPPAHLAETIQRPPRVKMRSAPAYPKQPSPSVRKGRLHTRPPVGSIHRFYSESGIWHTRLLYLFDLKSCLHLWFLGASSPAPVRLTPSVRWRPRFPLQFASLRNFRFNPLRKRLSSRGDCESSLRAALEKPPASRRRASFGGEAGSNPVSPFPGYQCAGGT